MSVLYPVRRPFWFTTVFTAPMAAARGSISSHRGITVRL